MIAIAPSRAEASKVSRNHVPTVHIYEDPLDPDQCDDFAVVTTRRGLTRLALVAAETGARFQRDGVSHDPMAWMLAPRRLFEGSSALEATLARKDCLRAVLLHGLALGLDAERQTIDAMLGDDDGSDSGPGFSSGPWDDGENEQAAFGPIRPRRLRLYSSIMVVARGSEIIHLFHASVAPNVSVVRDRIRARFGMAAAQQAEIQIGVDLTDADTVGMLPPAFRSMVERGRRIRWAALSTLDVTVEHRIPC